MIGTVGEIRIFGGYYAPYNWSLCNGQLLDITSNTALFAVLGTAYGGDGRTSFGLPDFRGRIGVHAGAPDGLRSKYLGEKGGIQDVTLTTAQMPAHTHSISGTLDLEVTPRVFNDEAETGDPTRGVFALTDDKNIYSSEMADTTLAPTTIEYTENIELSQTGVGGGLKFSVLPSVVAVNYIICVKGTYPSRSSG